MSLYGVVTALVLSVCWWMLIAAEDHVTPKTVPPTTVPGPGLAAVKPAGNSSRSAGNATSTPSPTPFGKKLSGSFSDSYMIQRALYVLIGITLTGVLYFLIRAVRLKKPAPKKKYGLLSNYDDSVEMEGVESDEDDTLYEARGLRR